MCEKFHTLTALTAFDDNARCGQYFESLWVCKEDWAFAYRSGLPLRGSNTTNYIEVAFRILKDCVFDRVMAYTLPQLIDFIVTGYAAYMEKGAVDFSCERYCKALLKNMTPVQSDIQANSIITTDAATGLYAVKSASSDKVYDVDLERGYCTCYCGSSGKLCKHASAVLWHADAELSTAYNVVSAETKAVLFEIGTGRRPPADWLLPLRSKSAVSENDPGHSRNDDDSSDTVEYSPTEPELASPRHAADEVDSWSAEEYERLQSVFDRIRKGIQEAPQIFVPACRRFIENSDKYAATRTGLVSALYTFGKYSGLARAKQQRSVATKNQKRRGVQIGVQPTAIGRRRLTLSGKRNVGAGRPQGIVTAHSSRPLSTHDYTTFGSLPSRKRKAPHSLQECVYRILVLDEQSMPRTARSMNVI